MELLQLKYFQIAAKTQNFSRAAEELNISQPSLSMTISHLENELGAELFDRKGRNIELNETGITFLARVNNVFVELENARTEISQVNGTQSKRISLVTTNPQLLSGVLKDFLLNHNDIVITQKCDRRENIEKQLQSGNVDFCLAVPAISGDNILCQILREDEVVLVVPENHKYSSKESIDLCKMADEPFIMLDPSYNFRKMSEDICKSAGFNPNIAFEVGGSLIKDMLDLNRGIALLPKYLIDRPHEGNSHLKMVKIASPNPKIQIGMSWQKHKYFSCAAQQFQSYFIENYSRLFA
jgi:LysR family transcriptional regulator, transcription activator of glutamate synthase operon